MSGRIFALLACLALTPLSTATWAEDEHLLKDVWSRALKMAGEKARELENLGQPRVVKKGAKPEIIIKGETITIDGKAVAFGEPLEKWKAAIPGTPSCEVVDFFKGEKFAWCSWETLGIEINTFLSKTFEQSPKLVSHIVIYMNFEPRYGYAKTLPDGSPAPPPQKTHPDHPFPGYLEMDGYGIDAKTEFWEVNRNLDPQREVYCGMRDCSHPEGRFGRGLLSFRLNNTSERGNIYDISISGSETYEPTPAKK